VPASTPLGEQRLAATTLRFAGMPSDRLWEFEDAQVNLGALEADPHQLARLLLVEAATVFGNDWLVVPVDVGPANLVRLTKVSYTTTFDEEFPVVPPPPPQRVDDRWQMFVVEGLDGLIVPGGSAERIDGPPLEDVLFLRDEQANLAWGIERLVQHPHGEPRSRIGEALESPQPGHVVEDAELDYALQTSVPARWFPFLPRTNGYASIELVRGLLDDATPPAGRLLNEPAQAVLADEEIPRAGVRVQRIPVLARTADGEYVTWVCRRVTVGRGEGSSGLAYDEARPR
jgi:hypothetical protein